MFLAAARTGGGPAKTLSWYSPERQTGEDAMERINDYFLCTGFSCTGTRVPLYPFTARITATHWSSIGRIVSAFSEGRLAETRVTPASR